MVDEGKALKLGFIVVIILAVGFMAYLVNNIANPPTYSTPQTHCSSGTCGKSQLQVAVAPPQPAPQVVSIHAGAGGYNQQTVTVNAGQPVKLEFSADQNAGCGRELLMQNFGVNLVSQTGETESATFTPPAGQYSYNCPMNMYRGTLIAK